MDKEKTFDQIVKELNIKQFEQTKKIEYEKKLEVINLVEKVEKEEIKNLKIKQNKFLVILKKPVTLVLAFIFIFLIYTFLPLSKIKDVIVVGNKTLERKEILDIAKIKLDNSITSVFSTSIKNNLENNDLIKKAFIKKDFVNQKIYIQIEELQGLFYYEHNGLTYVTDVNFNTQVVNNNNLNFPKFIDYLNVKDEQKNEFLEQLKQLKPSVINQISEIKYVPTKTYENRFLLKMNDRNFVYLLTTNAASKLNYYQELKRTLPKNQSVDVYLENADYFKNANR